MNDDPKEIIPIIAPPNKWVEDENYDPYYDPKFDQFHDNETEGNVEYFENKNDK